MIGLLELEDPRNHPFCRSELALETDGWLKVLCRWTVSFLQRHRNYATVFDDMLLRGYLITIENIVHIVTRRRGGISFFGFGIQELLFVQRAQQQFVVPLQQRQIIYEQPAQPDVVVRRQLAAPPQQIIYEQAAQPNVVVRHQLAPPLPPVIVAPPTPQMALLQIEAKPSTEHDAKLKAEYDSLKRQREETDAKARSEFDSIKRKREEDEKRVKAKYEAIKRQREENEARIKAEYEAVKRKREETEARTKAEHEARQRQSELNEARQRAEFEAAKRQQELDEIKKRAEFDAVNRQRELDDAKARVGYEVARPQLRYDGSLQGTYETTEGHRSWDNREVKKREEKEVYRKQQKGDSQAALQSKIHTPLPPPPVQQVKHAGTLPEPETDSDSSSSEDGKFDPYEALGLSDRERTPMDVIQSTYSRLALLNHPDKQISKPVDQQRRAAKRMCEINQAKDILLEEERKRAYDEVGAVFQFEFDAWKKSNVSSGSGYTGHAGKYYPSY